MMKLSKADKRKVIGFLAFLAAAFAFFAFEEAIFEPLRNWVMIYLGGSAIWIILIGSLIVLVYVLKKDFPFHRE